MGRDSSSKCGVALKRKAIAINLMSNFQFVDGDIMGNGTMSTLVFTLIWFISCDTC